MKSEVLIENVKFWVDQDILHCKFYSQDADYEIIKGNSDTYLTAISFLSEGTYLPLFINLREINGLFSFQVFKFLATHPKIKDTVVSIAFLTNSKSTNFLFSIYNFFRDPIIPNKLFINSKKAINYCNEKRYLFNAIS